MDTGRKSFRAALFAGTLAGALLFSALTGAAADKAVMDKGKKIYNSYCATCHKPNGEGMSGVYPPLAKSDYLKKQSKEEIIQSVVFGLTGKIKVNGKTYNGVMTPIPSNYSSADIAAVLTYVYSSWGNPGTAVSTQDVDKVKKAGKPKKK